MSQIDYEKIRLIVEKNMRDNGFQGQFENGWKDVIVVEGRGYSQQFNLQGLRDIISKSISDALKNNIPAGSISEGSAQGIPVVTDVSDDVVINSAPEESNNKILLNPSQAYIFLPTDLNRPKEAARKDDMTVINYLSDPRFLTVLSAMLADIFVSTDPQMPWILTKSAIISQYGGSIPSPETFTISGTIAGGSDSVRIGD